MNMVIQYCFIGRHNLLLNTWLSVGLCAGNIRRFRRICEHLQSQVCSRRPPASPRVGRKFATELSESSSCGSDTSDRLSPFPPVLKQVWNLPSQCRLYICNLFSTNAGYLNAFCGLILSVPAQQSPCNRRESFMPIIKLLQESTAVFCSL